jgi:hypothetical protein
MRVTIAFVFTFFAGAAFGVVIAAVLGTAAGHNAIERSYWNGVRAASSSASRTPAVSLIGPRRPPNHRLLPRNGEGADDTRRAS